MEKGKVMHIGIVCSFFMGHIYPMGNLAHELADRGHRATILGIREIRHVIEKISLSFYTLGDDEVEPGLLKKVSAYHKKKAAAGRLYELLLLSKKSTRKLFQNVGFVSRILCRDGVRAARELKLDALLVDQCSFEGATIAELAGIPFVTIANAVPLQTDRQGQIPPPVFCSWMGGDVGLLKRWRNRLGNAMYNKVWFPMMREVDRYRVEQGLRPHKWRWHETTSSLAIISNLTRNVDFMREKDHYPMHYVGPFCQSISCGTPCPFPFERLNGQPIIYVSLGTLHHGRVSVFSKIAEACKDLPVQTVITLGAFVEEMKMPDFPGNPIVVPFAPQLDILKKTSLFITHASSNGVMDALSCGVPVVAVPISVDQPGMAVRIQYAGVGEAIPYRHVTVSRIRRLVKLVLENDGYRKRALKLHDEIQAAGGRKRAVDIILNAVNGGRK